MITVSFINDSTSKVEDKGQLEMAIKNTFKYVKYGEVDILYDVLSPTSSLGTINALFFINIDDQSGNYYKTYPSNIYLHSLVIGFKKIELDDIIDINEGEFINEEGSWNYIDALIADNKSFDSFCYSLSPDIKHFKSALFYYVKAKNCKKTIIDDYIIFNEQSINLPTLLDKACRRCRSNKYNGAWSFQFEKKMDMHSFISMFISESEKKTKQGILTKRKMDTIRKDSVLIDRALNVLGSRLCILKGNAGAGKTLALMRIAYRILSKEYDKEGEKRSHTVRFLTYNNMLVYDINNTIKSMGPYTSSLLSVQTLHKFFFEMFKNNAVVKAKYSGEMMARVNDLINTCSERIDKINNVLLDSYNFLNVKERTPFRQIEKYQNKLLQSCENKTNQLILDSDKKEANLYFDFLSSGMRWIDLALPNGLDEMKRLYVSEKKRKSLDNYLTSVFLTDYENILKDMYDFFSDPGKFVNEHNIKSKWDFFQFIYNTDTDNGSNESIQEDEIDTYIENSIIKMSNKIKWSHAFLIDEAQDCTIYEKALLYKTRGSENIIIATGGKDQLIRKPRENDWTVLFGKEIERETITLRRTNYRQKANIVKFLNLFAEYYNLDSKNISTPQETEDKGHVIIDLRTIEQGRLPLDVIASLRNQGKDYGCSDYENIIALLPHIGYTTHTKVQNGNRTEGLSMSIDITDTITFTEITQRGISNFGEKEFDGTKDMNFCDCTINSKGDINPGHGDTRFMYYDSCRGLEAWNVMCLMADDFFYEKSESDDAKHYAIDMSGFIQEDRSLFQNHFAAIWCYMAFSRPMDTLYISLRNCNSVFSKELLYIANKCGNIIEYIK